MDEDKKNINDVNADFIEKFKEGSIKSNSSTIITYTENLINNLNFIGNTIYKDKLIQKHLDALKQFNQENIDSKIIENFIWVGTFIKIILEQDFELVKENKENIKNALRDLLEIKQYTKDQRVTDVVSASINIFENQKEKENLEK